MTNPLVQSRDQFSAQNLEQRQVINGRDWGVLQIGDTGPALVLMPGTLGRADIFWNQIEALGGRVRILALSYPEQGGIEDWCTDIAELMRMRGFDSATILGSSLGGYVAQYFAATYPELTDNLVAANTLPSVAFLSEVPPYSNDIANMARAELIQGFSDGLTKWAVDEPHRRDLVELLLMEVFGRIPDGEMRARLLALKEGPELPPVTLDKSRIFTVESLDDRLIPEAVRDGVRARLAPVRCEKFTHGSHFPYITEPAAYTAMLVEILRLET